MAKLMEFKRVEWVRCVPEKLEEGVMYISEEFKGMAHLCPCGCGEEVFIPYREYPCSDLYWEMRKEPGGKVTFDPSLQHRFSCKSHYYIRQNRVDWC